MKVLVVGGAGYIGSHAVVSLLEKEYEVVVLDNLEKGNPEALDAIKEITGKDFNFHEADLRDKSSIAHVFTQEKDIEAVMHFGAFIEVGESVLLPVKYYENNFVGSLNLVEQMLEHGVKKIVFSSTAATYGMPEKMPITEKTPQLPINSYGTSKLMVEKLLDDVYRSNNVRSVRLRYFNVAGDHESGILGEDHTPETHLIPLVLQAAAGIRENIKIFGTDYETRDGTAVRDYVHVEDLIDAHILALDYLDENDAATAFNLGYEDGTTVKEIIDTCKHVTGVDFEVIETDRRDGDSPALIADPTLAKKELGWKPSRNLHDIIESAWKWHLNNPKGYGHS